MCTKVLVLVKFNGDKNELSTWLSAAIFIAKSQLFKYLLYLLMFAISPLINFTLFDLIIEDKNFLFPA